MTPEEMDAALTAKMNRLLARAGLAQLKQKQSQQKVAAQKRMLDARRIKLVGTRLIERAGQDPTAHAVLSAIVAEARDGDPLVDWPIPALVVAPAPHPASPEGGGDGLRRVAPARSPDADRAGGHQAGPGQIGTPNRVERKPDLLGGAAA